jgi:hypothetical protein
MCAMRWAVLLQSEYRRVKKAALELARTNPIILLAIVAVPGGMLSFAFRAAEFFAVFAFIPGGLAGLHVLLLSFGLVTGVSFALTAPRERSFDEQFRLTAARPLEVLLGLRVLPLLIVVGVLAAPFVVMVWRVYALVNVPAPGAWAGVFALFYLTAAIQGAAAAEALRGYRAWQLFALATAALLGTVGVSLALAFGAHVPWYWLATYLPVADFGLGGFAATLPPAPVTALGATATAILSVIAWTAYSLRLDPPLNRRRITFSAPIGGGIVGVFCAWSALTLLRQGQARSMLALTLLTGIGAAALLSRWPSSGTVTAAVLLTAPLLLFLAATAVLTLSEDRVAGAWLLKTLPAAGASIGLAWWAATALLTVLSGSMALAPSAAFSGSGVVSFMLVLLSAFAAVTPLVGRLLPWSRQSFFKQLAAAIGLFVGVLAAYSASGLLAAPLAHTLGAETLSVPLTALAVLAAAAAASVTIEWLDA